MGECLFKRFICFKNFNEFFMYLFRWRKGGGCTNACIYMGTHSEPFLQNRLMDIYETWEGWSAQGPLQVLLFFGQISPGADPGRGKNRSQGGPLLQRLFFQSGRIQQQTKCIAMILMHVKWSIVTFGSKVKFLMRFRHLLGLIVILAYFNAISVDFYGVEC